MSELTDAVERLRRLRDGASQELVYGDGADCHETDNDIVSDAYLAEMELKAKLLATLQRIANHKRDSRFEDALDEVLDLKQIAATAISELK